MIIVIRSEYSAFLYH